MFTWTRSRSRWAALGVLEDLAAQIVAIRQEQFAEPVQKGVYVFAADHGITAEGRQRLP